MVMEGILRWSHHDESLDICVMTDYNPLNGNIVPGSFVHVTKQQNYISCECDIYKHLRGIAYENQVDMHQEIILDTTMTCMHCRLFDEELSNAIGMIQRENVNLPWALNSVNKSLQYMNDPIQLAGSVLIGGTTKFSIKSQDNLCAFVNITFNNNKCFAKCTNGICSAQMQNRKKIPKTASLQNVTNLCEHMKTIAEHLDYIKSFFPEHFEDGADVGNVDTEETPNNDDVGIADGLKNGTFNTETGLWKYPALSDHTPKQMMDEDLVHHTQLRNKCSSFGHLETDKGFKVYLLKPSHDSAGDHCQCGSEFDYSEEKYEHISTAVLYTRQSALECACYNLKCSNNTCTITYQQEAERRGIFFYSAKTAVADEVGWDFISSVQSSKTSFRGFCSEMTRRYQTNEIGAQPFLSGNTFIAYIFAWLSAFKIDFQKEIDPICKHDPSVLACDGTHIGVSVKNMNLQHAVTEPELQEVVKPLHKRAQRVLVYEQNARRHLKYITRKILGKINPDEILPPEEEERRNDMMLLEIQNMNHQQLTQFIELYVDNTQNREVTLAIARVMQMFCVDASMSSGLPFRSHPVLIQILDSITNTGHVGPSLFEMNKYNKQVASLLGICVQNHCSDVVVSFLLYLIQRIIDVHRENRPVQPANEIPNSYDPRKGVAYYFTETGNQIREMPVYDIPGNHRGNFDDAPTVDEPCTKNNPGVSFGGYGYVFLWFCLIHGHSYGFHLIAGDEGRKDPFSSLFKYKPTAPDEIFYDNTCQLNEYCLNREPGYFLSTRFWHDLFHALGHKCGCNFKSGRVCGLEGMNTEICEQVNAFLKCIKFTASHLSQEHFAFFLQFFLYLLNKEKTAKHNKLCTVAVSGHL